jgi:Fe-S-cluster containining protein
MSAKQRDRSEDLWKIYSLFEKWAGDFDFSCEKGCSTCCTRSVTMTVLEGELIHDHVTADRPELSALLDNLPENCPAPATTTNQFAAACYAGREVNHETAWDLSPCVFLRENCCTIYPVRPFMCRSFGSRIRCEESGEARVDPLFLTLNTIIMQCIEHLDQGRPWGNMNTILRLLSNRKEGAPMMCPKPALLCSEPVPGFLVPPEEGDQLHGRIKTLLDIISGSSFETGEPVQRC